MVGRSAPRSQNTRRRVAVLVDPGDNWGRQIIRGISSAVRHCLPWDLMIDPRDDQWRYRVPPDWQGDGVIAAIRDRKTAEHVRSLGVPTVDVYGWKTLERVWSRVITDDRKRAELAFTHFRERGFQHFAYYGPPSQRYPERRGMKFEAVVAAGGFKCDVFRMPKSRRGWNTVQLHTLRWLKRIPRPLGILAADPHPALQLSKICNMAGIRVPEEIAVLAGDTDDLLCDVADPPLSSIVLASEQIGRESVRVLHDMLRRRSLPPEEALIPPSHVIGRHSTDTLAVEDPLFVEALRFIRENAHSGINVGDILRVVRISRRLLEQRFQLYLNCSPADEIRRIKLDRVKYLLISTELTIQEIADSSGYSSTSQLCCTFRKFTGQTPLEFRRSSRHRRGTRRP